jgi:hypothetical protein
VIDCETEESSGNKFIPRQNTSNCSKCQSKADAVILGEKNYQATSEM